jgi:hypothetical protein
MAGSSNLNDYLLDQTGKDWAELLSGWSPPLPDVYTIWLVNRFGDVFAVFEDGTVHMLDVSNCVLNKVADSRDDFARSAETRYRDWLLTPLVDACEGAGIVLKAHQCYGFKVPPILGGKYEISNIGAVDISVHYSFLADIYRQTKDLPDGTRIEAVVGTLPRGT